MFVVVRRRPVRWDAACHRAADPPRYLYDLRVMCPVRSQPPVPPADPAHSARFRTEPVGLMCAVRRGQAAVLVGRMPSALPVGGVPSRLRVSRVPSGFGVEAADLGPPVLPVGPMCFFSPTCTVGLTGQRRGHVLAGRPGNGLLRGQRRIEPGHKVTPCGVLVALSALRVIPVRHVPTAAYRSLPSTIAAPGPVPGG